MPVTLPLTYYHTQVGFALFDDEFAPLTTLPYSWNLLLPPKLAAAHRKRPDILLSRLREEPELLKRCTPYTTLYHGRLPFNLRLSRVPLRSTLLPTLLHHNQSPNSGTFHAIREIASGVRRVIHLDSNHCNLQRDNLREVV